MNINECTEVLLASPHHIIARQTRAALYFESGDYESARRDYEMLIELDSFSVEDLHGLALVQLQLGELDEALANFQRVLQIDESHGPTLYRRGCMYLSYGKLDEALADFDKIIADNPNDVKALLRRVETHRQRHYFWDAIADLSTVLNARPNYLEGYRVRIHLYESVGEIDAAIADCDSLIARSEGDGSELLYQKAQIYNQAGRVEEALAVYSEIVCAGDDGTAAEAFFLRGHIYRADPKTYEQAVHDYTRALDLDSSFVEAYHARALLFVKTGRHAMALSDFDAAIDLAGYSDSYYERGKLKLRIYKDDDGAVADYTAAIAADPTNYDALMARAGLLLSDFSRDAALEDVTAAIAARPGSVEAWCLRARVYIAQSRWNLALNDLNRTLELSPRYAEAYILRGRVHQELHNYTACQADFKAGTDLEPVLIKRLGESVALLGEQTLVELAAALDKPGVKRGTAGLNGSSEEPVGLARCLAPTSSMPSLTLESIARTKLTIHRLLSRERRQKGTATSRSGASSGRSSDGGDGDDSGEGGGGGGGGGSAGSGRRSGKVAHTTSFAESGIGASRTKGRGGSGGNGGDSGSPTLARSATMAAVKPRQRRRRQQAELHAQFGVGTAPNGLPTRSPAPKGGLAQLHQSTSSTGRGSSGSRGRGRKSGRGVSRSRGRGRELPMARGTPLQGGDDDGSGAPALSPSLSFLSKLQRAPLAHSTHTHGNIESSHSGHGGHRGNRGELYRGRDSPERQRRASPQLRPLNGSLYHNKNSSSGGGGSGGRGGSSAKGASGKKRHPGKRQGDVLKTLAARAPGHNSSPSPGVRMPDQHHPTQLSLILSEMKVAKELEEAKYENRKPVEPLVDPLASNVAHDLSALILKADTKTALPLSRKERAKLEQEQLSRADGGHAFSHGATSTFAGGGGALALRGTNGGGGGGGGTGTTGTTPHLDRSTDSSVSGLRFKNAAHYIAANTTPNTSAISDTHSTSGNGDGGGADSDSSRSGSGSYSSGYSLESGATNATQPGGVGGARGKRVRIAANDGDLAALAQDRRRRRRRHGGGRRTHLSESGDDELEDSNVNLSEWSFAAPMRSSGQVAAQREKFRSHIETDAIAKRRAGVFARSARGYEDSDSGESDSGKLTRHVMRASSKASKKAREATKLLASLQKLRTSVDVIVPGEDNNGGGDDSDYSSSSSETRTQRRAKREEKRAAEELYYSASQLFSDFDLDRGTSGGGGGGSNRGGGGGGGGGGSSCRGGGGEALSSRSNRGGAVVGSVLRERSWSRLSGSGSARATAPVVDDSPHAHRDIRARRAAVLAI